MMRDDFKLIPSDTPYYRLIPDKAEQFTLLPGSSPDFDLIPSAGSRFTLVYDDIPFAYLERRSWLSRFTSWLRFVFSQKGEPYYGSISYRL